jgi:hypothetical protein
MRVLIFPRDIRRANNPYGELLYRDMANFGVEIDCFSPRRALCGKYDIFHLHWPEYYLNRPLPKALLGTLMVLFSTPGCAGEELASCGPSTTFIATHLPTLRSKPGFGEGSLPCSTALSA